MHTAVLKGRSIYMYLLFIVVPENPYSNRDSLQPYSILFE
eukprot:COSAG05_NODE_457_length_9624_cov_14.129554_1_plen_40_part_00